MLKVNYIRKIPIVIVRILKILVKIYPMSTIPKKTFKNLSEKIKKVISHEKIAVAPESAIATNPFHCSLECDITKIGITAKRQG